MTDPRLDPPPGAWVRLMARIARAVLALPPAPPRLEEIRLDAGVLTFALVASLSAGLLAGLAPALQATRPDLMDVLKNGAASAYASHFDIDWRPVNPDLQYKLLLPILGEQYGSVLENGQIQLRYDAGCARRAARRLVVDHSQPAVACQVDVELDELRPILQRGSKRGQRVLGRAR